MHKLPLRSLVALLTAAVCSTANVGRLPAQGGPRKSAPAGQEITDRAKAAKLNRAHASTGLVGSKKVTLTPADFGQVRGIGDLEAGQVIGVMETEATGDETGLPPGKYDLFAAKVGDQWHVYAEANGQIIKEAVRVRFDLGNKPLGPKPQFHAKGYGFSVSYCLVWLDTDPYAGIPQVSTYCHQYTTDYYDLYITPSLTGVAVGSTTQLTATLTLYRGSTGQTEKYSNMPFIWTSSTPAVATVSSSGLVTGVSPGSTRIKAAYRPQTDTMTAYNFATVSVAKPLVGLPAATYPALDFYW